MAPGVVPLAVDDRPARAQGHVLGAGAQRVGSQQQVARLRQVHAVRAAAAQSRRAPLIQAEIGVDGGQPGDVVVQRHPVRHVVAGGAAHLIVQNLGAVAAGQDARRAQLHHVRPHPLVLEAAARVRKSRRVVHDLADVDDGGARQRGAQLLEHLRRVVLHLRERAPLDVQHRVVGSQLHEHHVGVQVDGGLHHGFGALCVGHQRARLVECPAANGQVVHVHLGAHRSHALGPYGRPGVAQQRLLRDHRVADHHHLGIGAGRATTAAARHQEVSRWPGCKVHLLRVLDDVEVIGRQRTGDQQ